MKSILLTMMILVNVNDKSTNYSCNYAYYADLKEKNTIFIHVLVLKNIKN